MFNLLDLYTDNTGQYNDLQTKQNKYTHWISPCRKHFK